MSTNRILNIGILGLASIATRSIIPSIISLPEHFFLRGVASRTVSRATKFSSQHNCVAYESYEDLLLDPKIDAVYIPLPNALHFRFVMMALENGKHVLVEKSLGCSLDEVKKIVDCAGRSNLVVLENFQFRFHSQLNTILNLLKNGAIGDLRSMRVAFGFPPFQDPNNIRYIPELGGGALLDAGAYPLKIGSIFLGDDIFLAQSSMAFDEKKSVDIWGGGVLQQINSPLFCHFSYGFDHYYQCSLELWGSTGKISTNRIFTAPSNLDPKILVETSLGAEEKILPADDAFKNILKYFHGLIANKRNELVQYEYSQNLLQARLIQDFRLHAK
jgi:NDP-hexose-3-ketoreductase